MANSYVVEYTPSPEEIAEAAAQIRAGWDQREHYRRAGQPLPNWTGDDNRQEHALDSVFWTVPVVKAGWAQ